MYTIKLEPDNIFTKREIILDENEKLLSGITIFRHDERIRYIIETNDYVYCDMCDIFGTLEEKKKYAFGCPFHGQKAIAVINA